MTNHDKTILVCGASGYVGSRLVPSLLAAGYHVRAAGRSIAKLKQRVWASHPKVALIELDVADAITLERAMKGVNAVYYLIHSMLSHPNHYEDIDRKAAANMIQAAEKSKVRRIVYLGGLGRDDDQLSPHLRSRREVERILMMGSVPVTVFRAAMIIGSASASFEILRYLVERLPVMIVPRWVNTLQQPIAIENVIHYLVACLDCSETAGSAFDIGGTDVLSYRQMIDIYTEITGLMKRWITPVPVLTPRLSALWIETVTPVPKSLIRALVEGLRNPVVCTENRIRTMIPQTLLSCKEAIQKALSFDCSPKDGALEAGAPFVSQPGDPSWAGGVIRQIERQGCCLQPATKLLSAVDVWWRTMERGGLFPLSQHLARKLRQVFGPFEIIRCISQTQEEKSHSCCFLLRAKGFQWAQVEYIITPVDVNKSHLIQTFRCQTHGILGAWRANFLCRNASLWQSVFDEIVALVDARS